VALLDQQGTDGLTVRRLAALLDVASTALHWQQPTA
jgi:AcrR family transcriptional regulator